MTAAGLPGAPVIEWKASQQVLPVKRAKDRNVKSPRKVFHAEAFGNYR